MKSNPKSKIIILIALGILFAFLLIPNLSFLANHCNRSSEYSDDINFAKEYLKISATSGKIRIINNSGWVDFKNAGNCTGDGTYSDPYVIEDLIIDPGRWVTCIVIENSDVYFRIENCSLLYSGGAIRLSNVNNSIIIKNNCSSNSNGIDLWRCNNSTISGNTANNNNDWGISLSDCNNSTVSGNTANNNGEGIYLYYSHDINVSGNTANNNNDWGIFLASIDHITVSGNNANNNKYGIFLSYSDYNTISGNTANNNKYGIFLSYSDYNTISGNTANDNKRGIYLIRSDYNTISGNIFLGNDECIVEDNCEGNIFKNNDCGIIPGYDLFFLLGALSIAVILISKKLRKS